MKIRQVYVGALALALVGCDLPNTICTSTDECSPEYTCVTPGGGVEGLCKLTGSLSEEILVDLEYGDAGELEEACLPDDVCDVGLRCFEDICREEADVPPQILDFTLTPAFLVNGSPLPVSPGESVSFSWTTVDANECTLQAPSGQPVAAPTATDDFSVSIEESGDVVLRCRSTSNIAATEFRAVLVDTEVVPQIQDFTLTPTFLVDGSPRPMLPGESVSFSWTTVDANECTLQAPSGQPVAAPTATDGVSVLLDESGDVVLRCRSTADIEATEVRSVVVDPNVIAVSNIAFFDADEEVTTTIPGNDITVVATVAGPASSCEFSVTVDGGLPSVVLTAVENGTSSLLIGSDVQAGEYVVDTACIHVEGRVSGERATLVVNEPILEWRQDAATEFQIGENVSVLLDFTAVAVGDCAVSPVASPGTTLVTITTPVPDGGVSFAPPVGVNTFNISCDASVTPLEFTTAVVAFRGVPTLGALGEGFAGEAQAQVEFGLAGPGGAPTCNVVVGGTVTLLTATGVDGDWSLSGTVGLPAEVVSTPASLECGFLSEEPAIAIASQLVRMSASLVVDDGLFLGGPATGELTVTGLESCDVSLTLNDETLSSELFSPAPAAVEVLEVSLASNRIGSVVEFDCIGVDGTPFSDSVAVASVPPAAIVSGFEHQTGSVPTTARQVAFTLDLPTVNAGDYPGITCGKVDDAGGTFDGLVVSGNPPLAPAVRLAVPVTLPAPANRVRTIEFRCALAGSFERGSSMFVDVGISGTALGQELALADLDGVGAVFGFVDVAFATGTPIGDELRFITDTLSFTRATTPAQQPAILPTIEAVGGIAVSATNAGECAIVYPVLTSLGLVPADLVQLGAFSCD